MFLKASRASRWAPASAFNSEAPEFPTASLRSGSRTKMRCDIFNYATGRRINSATARFPERAKMRQGRSRTSFKLQSNSDGVLCT